MKFTKQKRHRKIVKFYTACFGFRGPYKVLCDGTFIHHLVDNKLTPDQTISNALGAPVQLFTTKCAIEELESLGRSYVASFHAARRDYRLARCVHEQKTSAWDCIIETIGDKNSEHFFVASQDSGLRNQCQKIPGVPVMYGLRNAVYLDQMASFQREYVKASEEERLRMTESEYKLLQKRLKNLTEDKSSTPEDGNEDDNLKPHVLDNRKATGRGLDVVKDTPQFKRKKAKGPNPLSCKPKKNTNNSAPKSGKNDNADKGAPRSRTRKRKRTRTTAKTPSGTDTTST